MIRYDEIVIHNWDGKTTFTEEQELEFFEQYEELMKKTGWRKRDSLWDYGTNNGRG